MGLNMTLPAPTPCWSSCEAPRCSRARSPGRLGGNALLIDAASFALLAIVVPGSGLRGPFKPDSDGPARTLFAEYLPLLKDRRIMVMIAALALGVFATAMADVAFVFWSP